MDEWDAKSTKACKGVGGQQVLPIPQGKRGTTSPPRPSRVEAGTKGEVFDLALFCGKMSNQSAGVVKLEYTLDLESSA